MGAVLASAAGTLTVTSPTEGAFLGSSNTLTFNITGATLEVTVGVDITSVQGTIHREVKVRPDADGKAPGSIQLNFGQGSFEGAYTLTVTATEPGNTYNTVVINVTVDVTKPKFFNFNPLNGSYVKGPNVPIVVKVQDANVKDYEVSVDGSVLATGTPDPDGSFIANWNTSLIPSSGEGSHTINIKVTDKAGNIETRSINIILDRVKPIITIQFPNSTDKVRPRSVVNVIVDIQDPNQSQGNPSIDLGGVDVKITDVNGNFLFRVARLSVQSQSATTVRWSGRIRSDITLPSTFKVVVDARDKAGNKANQSSVTAKVG